MRPIPVAFHIWFIEIHTYGIGLALTFWFGLRYTERRLRAAGYPWRWVTGMFLWVVLAAIVGARALHVLSNLTGPNGYLDHPGQIIAIWQGGLSSFGGLLFAVPTALVLTRRRCPELPLLRFADLMAPVLMACWGLGRLLGPQLMVAGGGHPTNQWFGMYYAGQVGKRLPVPIFQAMEDFAIFGVLLLVERWLRSVAPEAAVVELPVEASGAAHEAERVGGAEVEAATGKWDAATTTAARVVRASLPPAGIVLGVAMVLWGIERFVDEHLWLGEDGHLGSLLVQIAGVALAIAGVALLASRYGTLQRWRRGEWVDEAALGGDEPDGEMTDTEPTGEGESGLGEPLLAQVPVAGDEPSP
ncbi:MAG: prolipoprotein diacylglyceryl transferase family protein [Acidimicrobiales bacterium]